MISGSPDSMALDKLLTVEQYAEGLWGIAETGYKIAGVEIHIKIGVTQAIWVWNRVVSVQWRLRKPHSVAIKQNHPRLYQLVDREVLTSRTSIVAKIGGKLSTVASHDGNQGSEQ
jgi:hypothetical protein